MAIATPIYSDLHLHAYRFTDPGENATYESDIIDCRGAKNVWITCSVKVDKSGTTPPETQVQAIRYMIPAVPAGFTDPSDLNTTNARQMNPLVSEYDTNNNPVETVPNGHQVAGLAQSNVNCVGFISGTHLPPFFYIANAALGAGVEPDYTVWVQF